MVKYFVADAVNFNLDLVFFYGLSLILIPVLPLPLYLVLYHLPTHALVALFSLLLFQVLLIDLHLFLDGVDVFEQLQIPVPHLLVLLQHNVNE